MGGPRLIVFTPSSPFRRQTVGDKFQELYARAPKDAQDLEGLIDYALRRLDRDDEGPLLSLRRFTGRHRQ